MEMKGEEKKMEKERRQGRRKIRAITQKRRIERR